MVKLKDLLICKEAIKIVVEDNDYADFLKYAKQEGCIWQDGSVINPKKKRPSHYTDYIVVTKDYLIYQPIGFVTMLSLQNKSEYLFKKIKEDKIVDEFIERSRRTLRCDNEYELAEKAKKLAFKRRCEESKRISMLQLKYQNIANSLQKRFFVHYENDEELLKLILIFKEYGYENLFNIDIDNFGNDPKVIYVDNENMTFQPASISCVAGGLLAKKKLYTTDNYVKMMVDIFKEN